VNRRIDPLAEAARWLDAKLAGGPVPPLLLVLGLGEGHLLDLLETRAPQTRVLAIEPDPRVARRFHKRRDWTGWLQSGRLIYLVDPEYTGADEAWRIFPLASDAHTFLAHPAVENNPGPSAVRGVRVIKDILFGVRANADARRRFAPQYLVNSLRNLPAIAAGQDVRGLTNAFKGVPAVVAGAGPSLDENIEELRSLTGRAVLIPTGTALRPFLHAGLAPQLAVGLDPGVLNARHFHWLPDATTTWLVGESALDESAVAPFDGRIYWFRVSNHQPWPWYNDIGLHVAKIDVWGSVLTAAFQVAVLAGCDPIVFAGADLAFTGGRPHGRGSTLEFDWTRAVASGMALGQVWTAQIARSQNRCDAVDVHGSDTSTTQELLAFRDWLVSRAARSGRRVINATGAGILLGTGIEQMSLSVALSRTFNIPPMSRIPRTPVATAPVADLARQVRARTLAVGTAIPPTAPEPSLSITTQWREFCGEGYDAAAVMSALADTAHRLETGKGVKNRANVDSLQPAAGLVGLPEREAVLRAALSGEPLPRWARAGAIGRSCTTGEADPFAAAATALERLLALPGAPIDVSSGLLAADVRQLWDTAVLDARWHWSSAWRGPLWDYHDALAIGLATDALPPRAAAVGALRPGVRRLADDIGRELRACAHADLELVYALVRESVHGYNLVRTGTGYVAASHTLGPINLAELSTQTVDDSARFGLLLWASSEAELMARIERYLRGMALLGILNGWTSVAPWLKQSAPERAADVRRNLFGRLLDRAAGCEVSSRTADTMLDDLEACVVGPA
jgi:hypothetical protein